MISIHDPIHGTIEVTTQEIKLIDSRPFQRLRFIKQLGFSELAFPGASHSRYAHSLGAMQMATRMVDRLLPGVPCELNAAERARLRQAVRLAVLFHDLGHPPMSHVSERVMPTVDTLGLGPYLDPEDAPARQATHEDYTLKLLLHSELADLIGKHVGDLGVTPLMLASLVSGRHLVAGADDFVCGGIDLLPLLSQIVSSEMDADRMDYLRRDAYYCGVSYGNFDHNWLCNNLATVRHGEKLVLGLQHKAVWAFENFLLARYHMFLAVYYHHTPICFDHLLGRYYESGEYELPATAEGYLETDDVHLVAALRASKNPWASYVVRRRPYRLLVETHDYHEDPRQADLDGRLRDAKIDFFRVRSNGVLSKYFSKRQKTFPLLVLEPEMGRMRRIEEYTPLYRRFEDVVGVSRVYCHPEHLERAKGCLG